MIIGDKPSTDKGISIVVLSKMVPLPPVKV
jgi:hypothetical protein